MGDLSVYFSTNETRDDELDVFIMLGMLKNVGKNLVLLAERFQRSASEKRTFLLLRRLPAFFKH